MRILSGDSSDIVKIKGLKIIDFRIFETVYKSEKITMDSWIASVDDESEIN